MLLQSGATSAESWKRRHGRRSFRLLRSQQTHTFLTMSLLTTTLRLLDCRTPVSRHLTLTPLRSITTTPALRDERTRAPPNPIAPRASPTNKSNSNNLPILPLVAIFCLGSGAFYFLTKSRAGQTPAHTYELPDRLSQDKEQWPRTPSRAGRD